MNNSSGVDALTLNIFEAAEGAVRKMKPRRTKLASIGRSFDPFKGKDQAQSGIPSHSRSLNSSIVSGVEEKEYVEPFANDNSDIKIIFGENGSQIKKETKITFGDGIKLLSDDCDGIDDIGTWIIDKKRTPTDWEVTRPSNPKQVQHSILNAHTAGSTITKWLTWSGTEGPFVVSGGSDGIVKLWDTKKLQHGRNNSTVQYGNKGTCECCVELSGHSGYVTGMAQHQTKCGLVLLSTSGSIASEDAIRVWDIARGVCVNEISVGMSPIRSMIVSNSNPMCLLVATGKNVLLLDCRASPSHHPEMVFSGHTSMVETLATSHCKDGGREHFISGGLDGVRVWDTRETSSIRRVTDEKGVVSLAYSNDNTWFAAQCTSPITNSPTITGSKKQDRICGWNGDETFGRRGMVLSGHRLGGFKCGINFSNDSKFISSGDSDGTLWIWNWSTGKVARRIKCMSQSSIISNEWNPLNNSVVAVTGWDGSLRFVT